MATKKKSDNVKKWEIGAGITAATIAAAAGVYLLSDKKTKTKAKKWVADARKEIVKNAKTAKKLGEKEYNRIVDQAVKHYGSLENLTAADVIAAGKELKGEWNKISGEAKKMAKAYALQKATGKKKPVRKVVTHTKKARI